MTRVRIAMVTASAAIHYCKNNCLLTLRFDEEYWTQIISEILVKLKNVIIKLCQNIVDIGVRISGDTDRQVATVVMETAQLVLSQFKKNLFNVVNWELNKVYPTKNR